MKTRRVFAKDHEVLALLDGRKTQMRFAIYPQPPEKTENGAPYTGSQATTLPCREGFDLTAYCDNPKYIGTCPYGKPGDLFWVAEAWECGLCTESTLAYRATHKPSDLEAGWDDPIKWRPSSHMPLYISRLTLRITDVRVERLRRISEEDALAEGLTSASPNGGLLTKYGILPPGKGPGDVWESFHRDPRAAFRDVWQSINGTDSWGENPWVWRISFEVIKANVDQVLGSKAA